jgi:two-component system, NtrC family, response regulator AtoC
MIFQDKINLLIIEDEEYDLGRIKRTIEPFKDRLIIKKIVADGQSALNALEKSPQQFDVVIMDYQIVGNISGETLIHRIKKIDHAIQIIVITKMTINITDYDFANRLIEAGAMWYCTKYPADIDDFIYQPTDFILSILNAYHKKQLELDKYRSNKKLSANIKEILDRKVIIGESPPIKELRLQIEKLAAQDTTVLIYGASGTGKELVATHIHYLSKRKLEKFVIINSGSLPNELIESELFGFEKGSFTGAQSGKLGLFEVADQGSIFLDEIGELPPSAQVKLLRVLQDGEIDKIGRTERIKVNVRIIAATNKNLYEELKGKRFREDLFYRLNVATIQVPSLRERPEDIPLLTDFFLNYYCREMSIEIPQIKEEAMNVLINNAWPGNVRQLQNVLQRLLFLSDSVIEADHVHKALSRIGQSSTPALLSSDESWHVDTIMPWREMEKHIKQKYFRFVRENTNSDAEAARKLGLAPPNYYRMCKELGLK